MVFLSTDSESLFLCFLCPRSPSNLSAYACLSSFFFCGISALLPPEKGMKGHIRRTAAPSSRKRLRSYYHRRRLRLSISRFDLPPPPSTHLQLFGGKKRFILSKLNAITHLTITLKWSIAMMEIFLSLEKYPALCELKLLGAS